MPDILKIYSDGGSRGNPGPSACAFAVIDNGKIIYKESKFLEKKTNNEAEYYGLILALEWLNNNIENLNNLRVVNFFLDSELVVKQVNEVYRVKGNNLKPLFKKVLRLIKDLKIKTNFFSIPREKNKIADKLLNMEIDENVG
jgi:ribonuclease HI